MLIDDDDYRKVGANSERVITETKCTRKEKDGRYIIEFSIAVDCITTVAYTTAYGILLENKFVI